jgi:hypothetical protein
VGRLDTDDHKTVVGGNKVETTAHNLNKFILIKNQLVALRNNNVGIGIKRMYVTRKIGYTRSRTAESRLMHHPLLGNLGQLLMHNVGIIDMR